MDGKIGNYVEVNIREYKEEIDMEFVKKLEKKCDQDQSKQGSISMFTNTVDDDPLRRIRLYSLRVMLVAELHENGELVGVVRGCIKRVRTGQFEGRDVKLGSILGLRISPNHRRMGIGSRLVEMVEEWMIQNGAQYTFVAIEEKNIASKNLFALKYDYMNLCSMAIYVQPICSPPKVPSRDVKIEKLPVDQAISFYDTRLGGKFILYPTDIDEILKAKSSLGTWLCYSKDRNREDEGNSIITQNSWAIFSIWNTCDACNKYQKQTSPFPHTFKIIHSTISHARKKIFPCLNLKMPFLGCSQLDNSDSGYLFLYGVYGEGERVGDLMECVWRFGSSLGANVKGCNAIMIELGVCDPLREHVPKEFCVSCIEDLWYVKRVKEDHPIDKEDDELTLLRPNLINNVFVDPRDF